MEQQLARLKGGLQGAGLEIAVDQHILYPGLRRQQLVRSLLGKLLGGLSVEDVPLPSNTSFQGFSEDERFAERCRLVLQVFGVPATADQIRGCSKDQVQGTAVLVRIAELAQAMEQQRNSRLGKQQSAAPDGAVLQLLCNASQNIGQLTGTTMQLFASDMNDMLKAYSDQGALQRHPQLQEQVTSKLQHLKQHLQQMLAAGGNNCEGAGGQEWQQQITQAENALDQLLTAVQSFHTVYQQELSVWADVASAPSHLGQEFGYNPADSTLLVADSVGQAARQIVMGYKGLTAALEGFEKIEKQYKALQEVPVGILQEQKAAHHDTASQLRQNAAILQPALKA